MDDIKLAMVLDAIEEYMNTKLEDDYWGDMYQKVGAGVPLTEEEITELECLIQDTTVFKDYEYEGDIAMSHMSEKHIQLLNARAGNLWQAMREEVVMTMESTGVATLERATKEQVDNMTDIVVFELDWLWQQVNEGIADVIRATLGEDIVGGHEYE